MSKIKLVFNRSEAFLMAQILERLMSCVRNESIVDEFIIFMIVKTIKKVYHAHYTKLAYMEKDSYEMKLEPEHAACLVASLQHYFDEMAELHDDNKILIRTIAGHIHQKLL